MEEKKSNQAMGVAKNEGTQEVKKYSYEQLNEICGELYQQNQRLAQQLRQAQMTNMFRRLDYLFMVLQYEAVIQDPKFISNCVEEIKEAINGPAEDKKQDEEG